MSFKNRVAPEQPASAPAPSPLAIVEALQTSDSSASAADTAVDPDDDEEELAIPKRFTLGGASRSQSRRYRCRVGRAPARASCLVLLFVLSTLGCSSASRQ